MKRSVGIHLSVALVGMLFGLVLSRTGFTDFGQIQGMFRFDDLRLTLTFAAAVALIAMGMRLPRFRDRFPKRRIHTGTIPGGLFFGAGWALSGACPSIAWVQLGEGHLSALLTILGVVGGTWIHSVVQRRYLHWSSDSCAG